MLLKQRCATLFHITRVAVDLMQVLILKYSLFQLDAAGHMTTRREPDVARWADVVHHCFTVRSTLADNKVLTYTPL